MKRIAAITVRDQKRINRVTRNYERFPTPSPRKGQQRNPAAGRNLPVKFKAPEGGIPPLIGDKPGWAECEIYRVVGDRDDAVLVATGEMRDIYNWATVAICDTGNRFGSADLYDDLKWCAEAEQCVQSS